MGTEELLMKEVKFTCKGTPADLNEIGKMPIEECKKRLAELSKGLSHPARVEIVRMLEDKPPEKRCICGDIVNALPLAQSSVSQHLKVLKETGWLQGEIDGPRVCYCTVEGIMEYYLALIKKSLQGK
jgi:DNA-binding transcriptional ArsR family regulator